MVYNLLVAKKKMRPTGISKFLLGELVVLILLLLVLPYSNTLMYQSINSNSIIADENLSDTEQTTLHLRGETEGNLGSHLGGVQVVGRQLKVPILMYHYIGGTPDPADIARDNLSV